MTIAMQRKRAVDVSYGSRTVLRTLGYKVPEMREHSANIVECTSTSNAPGDRVESAPVIALWREKPGIGENLLTSNRI
jgi:hypothetical protein